MKVTDLMIGDLVLYVDKEGEIETPCKIHSLNQNGEWSAQILNTKFLFQGDNKECAVKECLKPILLTREILEKNGFNSYTDISQDWFIGVFKSEDSYIELTYSKGNIEWTNGNEYRIADLKYVHELQHALKLCGIEKEIVL